MSVYYGTVKSNAIVLPERVHLTEGIIVEVRVPSQTRIPTPPLTLVTEDEILQKKLFELGLLTEIKPTTAPLMEPVLVQVKGKPLSQMIIEERR